MCSRACARIGCRRAPARRTSRSSCAIARGTIRRERSGMPISSPGRFERGDLVDVRGRVERFRDELVVEVSDIRARRGRRRRGRSGRAFLPVAYRDLDELDGFLEHLATRSTTRGTEALLDSVLGDDELRAAFRRAPCTRNGHHAYLGGLLEHTVAVATLARELCDLHRRLEQRPAADRGDRARHRPHARVHLRCRDRPHRGGAAARSPGARAAAAHRALRRAWRRSTSSAGWRCCTACSAPRRRRGAGRPLRAPPRRWRCTGCNALDAGVKGALEHGLAATAAG